MWLFALDDNMVARRQGNGNLVIVHVISQAQGTRIWRQTIVGQLTHAAA